MELRNFVNLVKIVSLVPAGEGEAIPAKDIHMALQVWVAENPSVFSDGTSLRTVQRTLEELHKAYGHLLLCRPGEGREKRWAWRSSQGRKAATALLSFLCE